MMKGRVLIIDNDREHADVLSTKLKGFGYEVRTELSNSSVVETADSFSPTAIVADPFADEFDPFGLLRELRLQQPHTPIILTARNTSIEIALRAIQEEGADHYFEKPVDAEKFMVVLERVTELAETRRENEILRRQLRVRGVGRRLRSDAERLRAHRTSRFIVRIGFDYRRIRYRQRNRRAHDS